MPAGTARRDNQLIPVDERRSRDAIVQDRGAILIERIRAPKQLTRTRFEAAQFAEGAERVEPALVPSRSGARTIPAERLLKFRVPAMGPQLAPASHVVRGDNLLLSPLLDRKGTPFGNNERGVAAAHRL